MKKSNMRVVSTACSVYSQQSSSYLAANNNPRALQCLGMIGIVNRIESATDVYVEFINGEKFRIHPELLLLAVERANFEVGDLVLVRHDMKRLIGFLKVHIPDWQDDMKEVPHVVICLHNLPFVTYLCDVSSDVSVFSC